MNESIVPSESPAIVTAPPSARMRRLDLMFLVLSFGILAAAIWHIVSPSGTQRIHLILTGVGKGKVTPSVARFDPYKDKTMGGAEYAAAKIAELKKDFRDEPCCTLSLGNELSGSPEAYFSRGEAVIEALNAYQLDGMLTGNIDFSFGKARLIELAAKARFPFLSCNIREEGTGQIPSWILPERILSPGQGLKIAVLALTPPQTPQLTARGNVEGLRFSPPGSELAEQIRRLRGEGCDLVVLASLLDRGRLSPEDWGAIKQAAPDVVLMVDFQVEPPPPQLLDGILVKTISGYNQGKELDLLHLEIGPEPNRVASFSGSRIPIFTDEITPDSQVAGLIRKATEKIQEIKNQKICEFSHDLQRDYDQECPIGNLVTDAMRFVLKADLALQNSGGIQSNIRQGVFTLGDLYNVLPFDNEIVSMDLTGQDLLELLTLASSLKRGVLQISGGGYSFSNRSLDDFELKSAFVAGVPLVATRTYRVTATSFLADAGDEYRPFKRGRNLLVGPLQREVVRGYLQLLAASGPIDLKTQNRIVREINPLDPAPQK